MARGLNSITLKVNSTLQQPGRQEIYMTKLKIAIFGNFPLLSQVDTTSKISDRKDGFITATDMNNVAKSVVHAGTYAKM